MNTNLGILRRLQSYWHRLQSWKRPSGSLLRSPLAVEELESRLTPSTLTVFAEADARVETQGIDIVLAFDISGSMNEAGLNARRTIAGPTVARPGAGGRGAARRPVLHDRSVAPVPAVVVRSPAGARRRPACARGAAP